MNQYYLTQGCHNIHARSQSFESCFGKRYVEDAYDDDVLFDIFFITAVMIRMK